MSYQVAHVSELETFPVGERGLQWRPIRSRFGVEAFGVNAYTSAEIGGEVVEEHTEATYGHEELYVVVSGRATFTLDGDEVDAPAGTLVHLPDPMVRRGAVAREPGTTVLAVGGKRGEAFRPSGWEWHFRAGGHVKAGDYGTAISIMEEGLARNPDDLGVVYNAACYFSLAGEHERALQLLQRAIALDPKAAGWAKDDADFDSIRGEVSAITG